MTRRFFAGCVMVGITVLLPLYDALGITIPSVEAAAIALEASIALWFAYRRSEEWQA